MKTVLGLMGLVILLGWPMRAQDAPPEPPAQDAPEAAPAGPPTALPDFRGPQGPRQFGAGPRRGMGFGTWWKNSEIVSKLQLSDDQVKKIEQTYFNHRLKLVDLRADLEKQELQLRPLLDADQPDEQKVGAQIDLITSAREAWRKRTR